MLLFLLGSCGGFPRPFAGNPGATALRLAHPPPARLTVPAPDDALLPAADAAAWARDTTDLLVAEEVPAFAEPTRPGDWQLALSARLQGSAVLPHYSLRDATGAARGDIDGPPVPQSAWAGGGAQVFRAAAAAAAPKILSLLKSVDATIKQSDPNSLYNRPARIYFAGVSGAPGNGDAALNRQMRVKLPQTGDMLVDRGEAADFTVRGTVRISDVPGGQQQVEIHWLVFDWSGKEAGDVAQGHDIPKGLLDHDWGDVADAITAEAAGGVHTVITNWTGRHPGEKRPPGA